MVKTINLGGQPRPIYYSINALIEFEELTGIDLVQGSSESRQQLTKLKNIRALAFVGLKHGCQAQQNPVDFTLEDVGSWIGFNDGGIANIMQAFKNDMPTPEAVEAEEQEAETEKN